MPPAPRPLHAPALIVALALALAVGACGPSVSPSPSQSSAPSAPPTATAAAPSTPPPATATPGPSPSPLASGEAEAIYSAIESQVIEIRGLEPKQDVTPQTLSEAELRERTTKSFEEDNPEELIVANQVLYEGLGMIDEGASLKDLYIDLLSSQVAGFYDPETDELYVVARSGTIGVAERVTFAHEFTHALQDQYFDLESFQLDEIGQGDRNTAALSLIEGDATAAMTFWAQTYLTPQELVELLQVSLDPEQQAVLAKMPPVLRESLEFPYTNGLQLVLGLQTQGGWDAVNDAFADPPTSTEQLLHADKNDPREEPTAVDLPDDLGAQMGTGWKVTYEDTFGEFQIQVWLRNALRRVIPGNEAAAGWGGDRFAVLQGPNDAWAIALATDWDTAADAAEFEAAATDALSTATGPGGVLPGVAGTVRWVVVAVDDATLSKVAGVLGLAG